MEAVRDGTDSDLWRMATGHRRPARQSSIINESPARSAWSPAFSVEIFLGLALVPPAQRTGPTARGAHVVCLFAHSSVSTLVIGPAGNLFETPLATWPLRLPQLDSLSTLRAYTESVRFQP